MDLGPVASLTEGAPRGLLIARGPLPFPHPGQESFRQILAFSEPQSSSSEK